MADIGDLPAPCPECRQGKHPNCTGDTWDPVRDAPAACPCYMGSPHEHQHA